MIGGPGHEILRGGGVVGETVKVCVYIYIHINVDFELQCELWWDEEH